MARLRQFEGWRCLWRLPLAALAFALPALVVVGASVLAAFLAGGGFNLRSAVVAAVVGSGATGLLAPRLARRKLHRKVIAERLWTFEEPNPATEVQVYLRSADARAAQAALRNVKFNPQNVSLGLGSPPADAPYLDRRIAVHEPAAWPQSASDEDRTKRIAAVLGRAGLRARAGGLDVFPGGDETTDADGRRDR